MRFKEKKMSVNISKISAALFSVYAAYCFLTGCFAYYISVDFKMFSLSLWVEFIYSLSTAAFAVCLMLYIFKGIKANFFKKALPLWLFINAVLSTGLSTYPTEGGIYAFFSYAAGFIIRYSLIFLILWLLDEKSGDERIFRISVTAVLLGFAESVMIFLKQYFEILLYTQPQVSIRGILYFVIFLALFIAALILRKSKIRAVYCISKIYLLLYCFFAAVLTLLLKISYFFIPEYINTENFFNIMKSDLILDADFIACIGCAIIFVLTIKSVKVKK